MFVARGVGVAVGILVKVSWLLLAIVTVPSLQVVLAEPATKLTFAGRLSVNAMSVAPVPLGLVIVTISVLSLSGAIVLGENTLLPVSVCANAEGATKAQTSAKSNPTEIRDNLLI